MYNIYKYIKKYGNKTFEEHPVTELDILIFTQIPYINFTNTFKYPNEEVTLSNLWERAKKHNTKTMGFGHKIARKLLEEIYSTNRYKDLILKNYIYNLAEDTQFGAISIVVPNEYTYIVFEGTDNTIWGWKEDFKLAYTYPTESQKMAAKYLNDNIKFNGSKVVICGHSKGGNLALVGAMNTNILKKTKIHKIYSLDGPGLRKEEFRTIKYKLVRNKLINIIPNASLIGILLKQENVKVIKSRGLGLLQHDVTTWVAEDNKLKPAVQDKLSQSLDESISVWLDKHNRKEREEIIEGIFSVFESSGIKTFNDIDSIEEIYKLIKSTINLSEETKEVISNSLRLLMTGIGTNIINEGKQELEENLEKYFGKDSKILTKLK